MLTVVLVIHLFIAVALIGVILMQKSESGAFGDGSPSSFVSVRARGDIMTQTTAILATAFICSSILLSILTGTTRQPAASSILEQSAPGSVPSLPLGAPGGAPPAPAVPAPPGPGDAPKQ